MIQGRIGHFNEHDLLELVIDLLIDIITVARDLERDRQLLADPQPAPTPSSTSNSTSTSTSSMSTSTSSSATARSEPKRAFFYIGDY
ncbi:hypothetical protein ElyMa_005518900 [Elysia marginata]|uniref:Uncharacterized protein n=1 Tax=Elysia marginata TaxID=1093978 RepID=A0AAV4EWW7_9GAST|nr:hypothetical protein ElyMa_005518900 [Elysia marginata]